MMILAPNPSTQRRNSLYQPSFSHTITIPNSHRNFNIATSIPATPQSAFNPNDVSNLYSFGADQILFDFQPEQFDTQHQIPAQTLMQSEQPNANWLLNPNGPLTPRSTQRVRHNRESSLSSAGSTGPASPYTANTSSPHVVGDNTFYNDHLDYNIQSAKLFPTPAQTPFDTHFPIPYAHYSNSNPLINMAHDGMLKQRGDAELMPAPEYNSRLVANHESQSTPSSSHEDERQISGMSSNIDAWLDEYLQQCGNTAPYPPPAKLARTITDIESDNLYNPNHSKGSGNSGNGNGTSGNSRLQTSSPLNTLGQRLRTANNQHLLAYSQSPATTSPRERSPFRQNAPLAPTIKYEDVQPTRLQSAKQMREQQKMFDDQKALMEQIQHSSPQQESAKTVSPKDVDLHYHESEEDSSMSNMFPPMQQQQQAHTQAPSNYRQQQQPPLQHEVSGSSDNSYASMATTRRENSSAYSASSQATPQQGNYNFGAPAISGNRQLQVPQQYPFISEPRRQQSNLSNYSEEFPATLTSMESSSSEYTPDASDVKRPGSTSAESGTYTCTYHGCTLRFETPAKLQRHKREAHRNSALRDSGMTSSGQKQNSQSGPHRCDRINPSTGKPCNTIFSRPYDLTRHEDTIHNEKRQKLRCDHCDEEKTFSRADALTRHYRVVHPHLIDEVTGKRKNRII